ncbi:FYVE, RhoGEF and PH domain-containing protein 6-like [Alosa sapidissima]|uniref:FYVE, RhoGEF and PH domain-containing protein 6-like n=1 Tax=Alosa sapidissima TaxID=34773 RepID=UPI001C091233|nr:FYVE, RhoGEF and PH domain-containing protein 6-like [Alosa sapidissima]
MMMRTGVEKPPLAPKPKAIQKTQKPKPPPIAPKPGVLSQPSSVEKRTEKPPIAPKPCLPQNTHTSAHEKPPVLRTNGPLLAQQKLGTTSNVGLLNSRNGIHLGPKKREWDYIIPICVCSRDDCPQCKPKEDSKQAITNPGKDQGNKQNEGFKKLVPRCRTKFDIEPDMAETKNGLISTWIPNSSPLESLRSNSSSVRRAQEVMAEQSSPVERLDDRNAAHRNSTFRTRRTPLQRTWSDEVNGNTHCQPSRTSAEPSDSHRLDGNQIRDSTGITPSIPAAPQKPLPTPAPRRPRAETPVHQGDTKMCKADMRTSSGMNLTETMTDAVNITAVSSENTSLYESVETGYVDLHMPVPIPRQKTGNLEKPAPFGRTELANVAEYFYKATEFSVDADDGDVENSESPCTVIQPKQLKLTNQLTVATRVRSENGKPPITSPEKQHRQHFPTVTSQSTKKEENTLGIAKDNQSYLNPAPKELDNTKKSVGKQVSNSSPGNTKGKLFGQSLRPKAKSFTSVDLLRPDGSRKISFRKFLDINISVKKLPKLLTKRGQATDCMSVEMEESVDGDEEREGAPAGKARPPANRKLSCPVIGMEQSVDGEDIFPGAEAAVEYENFPIYEDIPDYMNLPGSSALAPSTAPDSWQSSSWPDEENIYEEQDPYELIGEYADDTQQHNGYERARIEEDVGQGYGHSEEEICHSSEDEDDRSTSSSQGDHEGSEHNHHVGETKKSKVVHIAREIMSSEKVFVDVLKLLHIDFRDAVAKVSQQAGKPVIEERNLNQILYYLPQLYELNQDLLKELEDRVAQWDQYSQLADIFVKKGPYLKMYSTYIREFDKNVALLDEQCRKNPSFAAAVREFEASPRCANLALRHYLLKPIQRIPQYQLLLTDYLKNLTEDSTDYKDTQAALSIVKEVANHANDIMKQGDNFQKLIEVQCRLTGHHEIVQPGRVFLKEGILMKLSRKVMQPRMFFLFNDALLYTTPVQSGQFKLNNMLSLAGMKVTRPSQEGYQNELNIESVERSFILSASSESERDAWLEAISTAIGEYTKKMITFISSRYQEEGEGDASGASLGSKAPIWIPDPRTTMCMICTCEFTLTWRRHHCRACGKVVCQTCSNNKHQLEYLKNQPARVCDQCFVSLQKRTAELTLGTGGQAQSNASSTGKSAAFPFRKHKRIPAALKEVSANTDVSSMSGYLERSKGNKKQWKRFWFVIKDKVLYTYAASEDVAALESQPLLGFKLRTEERAGTTQTLQFKLYHKDTLHHMFKADDTHALQRWTEAFQKAMVL